MQIRLKEDTTRDEALMLLELANAEVAIRDQRIAELEAVSEASDAYIAKLEADNYQLRLEMDAVGAGGVSGQRITGGQP